MNTVQNPISVKILAKFWVKDAFHFFTVMCMKQSMHDGIWIINRRSFSEIRFIRAGVRLRILVEAQKLKSITTQKERVNKHSKPLTDIEGESASAPIDSPDKIFLPCFVLLFSFFFLNKQTISRERERERRGWCVCFVLTSNCSVTLRRRFLSRTEPNAPFYSFKYQYCALRFIHLHEH